MIVWLVILVNFLLGEDEFCWDGKRESNGGGLEGGEEVILFGRGGNNRRWDKGWVGWKW
jgi:hypothetical protein